ncbi:hypothetical protein CDV36_005213, partial [Fusarium kuroshium]
LVSEYIKTESFPPFLQSERRGGTTQPIGWTTAVVHVKDEHRRRPNTHSFFLYRTVTSTDVEGMREHNQYTSDPTERGGYKNITKGSINLL